MKTRNYQRSLVNNWNDIDWNKAETNSADLQYEILKAHRREDCHKVSVLQHALVKSFAARCLAVRKVTSNKGGYSPGIDGKTYNTDIEKFEVVRALYDLSGYKADPVRRVYIPRPDARSYGFRKFHGVHDCVTYLKLVCGSYTATRRHILDADVEQFFPSVSHQWLLDNIPIDKKILREFLKAGFCEDLTFHPVNEGFPQGSPISQFWLICLSMDCENGLVTNFYSSDMLMPF